MFDKKTEVVALIYKVLIVFIYYVSHLDAQFILWYVREQ